MTGPGVETVGSHFGRYLLLATADSLREGADIVASMKGEFVLFVAADTRALSTEELTEFAQQAIQAGTAYACAWGPDCDPMELAFDTASEWTSLVPARLQAPEALPELVE